MIVPALLSGGIGSRLWPLSRIARPKQLQPLANQNPNESLLAATARRVSQKELFLPPLIICSQEHNHIIKEEFKKLNLELSGMILEPVGRNTAPAAVISSIEVVEKWGPDLLLLLMPSDHLITDNPSFLSCVKQAGKAARVGGLVTFGIKPTEPATGYGYIHHKSTSGEEGCSPIEKFIEKPSLMKAQEFLDSGGYLWNSGIFIFSPKAFLEEAKNLAPELYDNCRTVWERARREKGQIYLGKDDFIKCESISLDYAVMEKTQKGMVIPSEFGWSDVGSFKSLHDLSPKDKNDNSIKNGPGGQVVEVDSHGNLLICEEGLLTVVGLENTAVVATRDATLVVPLEKSQEVKKLVDQLIRQNRKEVELPAIVERPWGTYQSITSGEGYQAKIITVLPGQKLSLQKHQFRAEHWIVIKGLALVTRNEEKLSLNPGDYVFLPLGCVHRLENPGKIMTVILELQMGSYTGEDDIIRLEDIYGRAKP